MRGYDPATRLAHVRGIVGRSDTSVRRSRQLIADSRALIDRGYRRGLWPAPPDAATDLPDLEERFRERRERTSSTVALAAQVQGIAVILVRMSRRRLADVRATVSALAVCTDAGPLGPDGPD